MKIIIKIEQGRLTMASLVTTQAKTSPYFSFLFLLFTLPHEKFFKKNNMKNLCLHFTFLAERTKKITIMYRKHHLLFFSFQFLFFGF